MTTLADIIVSDEADTSSGNPASTTVTQAATADDSGSTSRTSASADADVPEKFRGKSLKDVIAMYENIERDHGRLANELGTQRMLTDRILQLDQKRAEDLRKNTPSEAQVPKVTTDDILNRPQEVLDRVTDARARAAVEPFNERIAQLEAQLARTRFEARHQDFQTIVNSPDFVQWVQASPLRMRAAVAANAGNWDVAKDLLDDYKQSRASRAAASRTTPDSTDGNPHLENARKASLERGGSAGSQDDGGGGQKPGPKYKRVELMKMRLNDPEAYYDDDFQAKLLQAYAEGRVV